MLEHLQPIRDIRTALAGDVVHKFLYYGQEQRVSELRMICHSFACGLCKLCL
jgi:hypothetical protein